MNRTEVVSYIKQAFREMAGNISVLDSIDTELGMSSVIIETSLGRTCVELYITGIDGKRTNFSDPLIAAAKEATKNAWRLRIEEPEEVKS